jgi:hypothetical protein
MAKNDSEEVSLAVIENCLHDVLNVCNKIGGGHHKEAMIAIISQYRTAANYASIRFTSSAMLQQHTQQNTKIDFDDPDTKARMEAFRILGNASIHEWDADELVKQLDALYESKKKSIGNPGDLRFLIDAIPPALADYRASLEEIDSYPEDPEVSEELDTASAHPPQQPLQPPRDNHADTIKRHPGGRKPHGGR